MRAVVTAGGTSEPIDDVRVLTNLSSGRFGAACASALADRGWRGTAGSSGGGIEGSRNDSSDINRK